MTLTFHLDIAVKVNALKHSVVLFNFCLDLVEHQSLTTLQSQFMVYAGMSSVMNISSLCGHVGEQYTMLSFQE